MKQSLRHGNRDKTDFMPIRQTIIACLDSDTRWQQQSYMITTVKGNHPMGTKKMAGKDGSNMNCGMIIKLSVKPSKSHNNKESRSKSQPYNCASALNIRSSVLRVLLGCLPIVCSFTKPKSNRLPESGVNA